MERIILSAKQLGYKFRTLEDITEKDFDYFIKDGNVQIKIEVGIHGVVEGEDRYVRGVR